MSDPTGILFMQIASDRKNQIISLFFLNNPFFFLPRTENCLLSVFFFFSFSLSCIKSPIVYPAKFPKPARPPALGPGDKTFPLKYLKIFHDTNRFGKQKSLEYIHIELLKKKKKPFAKRVFLISIIPNIKLVYTSEC